jgi:hypothetical protein
MTAYLPGAIFGPPRARRRLLANSPIFAKGSGGINETVLQVAALPVGIRRAGIFLSRFIA